MPALSNKLVVALANDYAVLRFPVESFKLGQNDGTLRLIHAPTDAYPGMHNVCSDRACVFPDKLVRYLRRWHRWHRRRRSNLNSLLGKKLAQPIVDKITDFINAPKLCAVSSISGNLCLVAIALI